MTLVAKALRHPHVLISQSTGRTRLIALQRFLVLMAPEMCLNALLEIATLDSLLPSKRAQRWNAKGQVLAGTPNRRCRRGPTLRPTELQLIVSASGQNKSRYRTVRDRALLSFLCFSGLRMCEVLVLQWDQIADDITAEGVCGLTASFTRDGTQRRLLLLDPIGVAIGELREHIRTTGEPLTGFVFSANKGSIRRLSYEGARRIIAETCQHAGLPPMLASDLRAACAYWMKLKGFTDHEVASLLGLSKVRSVDRLLKRHKALDAQRVVREHVDT